MKIDYVLDSSVILALMFGETGWEAAEQMLPSAAVSAVNASEVIAKLLRLGAGPEAARRAIDQLGVAVLAFTLEDAEAAARLERVTRPHGLSLGDRACLAAAERCEAAAVTADRNWRIPRLGVQVRFIR